MQKITYSGAVSRQLPPVGLVGLTETAAYREKFPTLWPIESGRQVPRVPNRCAQTARNTGDRVASELYIQRTNQAQDRRGNLSLILHRRGENAFLSLRQTQGIQHHWISHHFTYQSGAVLVICRDSKMVEENQRKTD